MSIRSPLSVVILSPEFVIGFIHEHAVLEEHDVHNPPETDHEREDEEELPVGPGYDGNENRDEEEIKECPLRRCVPHFNRLLY